MSTVNLTRYIVFAAMVVCSAAATASADPFVYVLSRTLGTPRVNVLTVIDAATNSKGARITLGTSNGFILPQAMAMAPDGTRIYVANDLEGTISVVSTATNTVEETWPATLGGIGPRALAVSPDGQRLYVARLSGSLTVVDVASRTQIADLPLGLRSLLGVAASPDGSRVYAMAPFSDTLAIVGTAPFRLIATVNLDLSLRMLRGDAVSLSPDGRFAYLPQVSTASGICGNDPNCGEISPPAGAESSRVSVLDTTTNTIVATTKVGSWDYRSYHVAASPNGAVVYAPNTGGQLVRLSPSTHERLGETQSQALETGRAVAFLADSSRAYVATDQSVVAVNAATHEVMATIPFATAVDGRPNAIVTTPPEPPGPPSNLRATVTGNRVSLSWDPAIGAVAGYVLEGGVRPGEVMASIPTGQSAPTFSFDAPTGAFYIRMHAIGGGGRSVASNEIQILVNVPQPPSAPAGLRGLVNGSNVALSWTNTFTGGQPTALMLDVSGAITTSLPLPLTESFEYSGVPPGTYTFTVRAINGTGSSSASSPVTLAFPGTCPGAPQAPTNFIVTRQGSQLTASWDPPRAGSAVNGYLLIVTGAMNLTLPLSDRSVSGGVPPGTYQLSVRAVNPCGAGPGTPVQQATVP
jgi:YVTN family beta-propeller protein